MALKLNEAYPGRFNNPSPEYPQGSFKNRTTPTAEDGSYFEQQWANDHLAFLSSLLDGAGVEANGAVDQVGASQYYNALLQVIASQNADTINAPIATVAAAGTINLTTSAPNTSQLAISGTGVSINGFTVSANRFFIVKMTGASNTLVNSAPLVTGRGSNIPVVAGDTFLMRSTAANTVEIVSGTFLIDRAIGSGQTWQNLTASRVAGTTYTNATGRSIVIQVWGVPTSSGAVTITVSGEQVANYLTNNTASGAQGTVSAVIPHGATYSYSASMGVQKVVELR